jgi:cell division protein FtsB
MGLGDRVWNAFTTVIQMRDKIASLTEAVKTQQAKLEELTERTIRLEAAIELLKQVALARRTHPGGPKRIGRRG